MMAPTSRIWIGFAAGLTAIGSGCLTHHFNFSPYKPEDVAKRDGDFVKSPAPASSDKPLSRDATSAAAKDQPPAGKSAAEQETNTAKPASSPKVPVAASSQAMDGALAQLDAIPSLSAEERTQLKQDLAHSRPEDLHLLIALVTRLSEREGKPPAKAAPPVAPVSHAEPVRSEPAPAEPLPLAPAADAKPLAQGALPQIIGPNTAAPPITILPPQSYPGVQSPAPSAVAPQPMMIMNPLAMAPYPPLPIAPGQPTNPPAFFPNPHAQPLIPPGLAPPMPGFPTPPAAPWPADAATPIAPASHEAAIPNPAAANPPPAPVHWSKSLREALKELERELATNKPANDKNPSADVDRARKAILVRLLRLAAGDQEGAVRRLEELPPDEQEFWTHQLHALGISLDPDGSPVASRRAALTLRELRQATAGLAGQATLEVRNLAFCSEVIGYGHYQRFPTLEFEPEQEVLLYAEIDNLQSAETKTGFRTNFQASLQVLDSAGKVVYDHTYPAGEDICTSRRRDFFVPFRTYIPKLSAGEYTLQLTVEDTQAKKFGQSTISFRIKRR